jgi:ATP-dependent Clp protease ATP-binding subunit ClpC
LNRIDEIIVFRALTKEQVEDIARLMLEKVTRRLRAQRIDVEFTPAAVSHIAEEGFDLQFGARPLKRAVQRTVESQLSRRVLQGELGPEDNVTVDFRDGQLSFDVTKQTQAAPAAATA